MTESYELSISTLIEISNEFIKTYFFAPNIHALLLLSLITVTTYSRKKHRLRPQVRVNLSIAFLPDLIKHLVSTKVISEKAGNSLSEKCKLRKNELYIILEAYLYAAKSLATDRSSTFIRTEKKRCILL